MAQVKFVAAALIAGAILAGCGRTETPVAAAPSPAVKEEPAFVEGLPRNKWLTAEVALPLNADGTLVKDEKRRPYSYELVGQKVPAFTAPVFGGGEATEEVFRGKWTVVDFWGVWCGDCRRDAPFVRELVQALKDEAGKADQPVQFLSIHTPPSRARAAEQFGKFGSLETYFANEGGAIPTVIDTDAGLREAFRIVWTPTYLLVGPDLTIRAFRTDLSVGGEGNVKTALGEVKGIAALE